MADSSDETFFAEALPATKDDLAGAIFGWRMATGASPSRPEPETPQTPLSTGDPRLPDRSFSAPAPTNRTSRRSTVQTPRAAGVRRLRQSVERVQQLARAPKNALHAAQDLPEKLKTTRVAAVRHARQERSISNGQYYVLLIAALLLTVTATARAGYLVFEVCVRGFTWSRALWSSQHEEFRVWTAVTCSDPWQAETVLCQVWMHVCTLHNY